MNINPYMIVDLETNEIKLLNNNKIIPLRKYFEYYELIEPNLLIYTRRAYKNLYSAKILGYSIKGNKIILGKERIERKMTLEEVTFIKLLYSRH